MTSVEEKKRIRAALRNHDRSSLQYIPSYTECKQQRPDFQDADGRHYYWVQEKNFKALYKEMKEQDLITERDLVLIVLLPKSITRRNGEQDWPAVSDGGGVSLHLVNYIDPKSFVQKGSGSRAAQLPPPPPPKITSFLFRVDQTDFPRRKATGLIFAQFVPNATGL